MFKKIIIIIKELLWYHRVVTSEVLGPGSVLLKRVNRESPEEKARFKARLKYSVRVTKLRTVSVVSYSTKYSIQIRDILERFFPER